MAKKVNLEIITPSKVFYRGDVELVIIRTLSGDEGFMAGHEWACKLLAVSEMWIQETSAPEYKIAAISGGFIDVKDSIVIYTDAAEWAEDIDMEKALSEKARAEDWLAAHPDEDAQYIERAKIAIQKSITRMNVSQGGARRKR